MENIKATVEDIVTSDNTALSVGSGSLEVFATPAMLALMEKAACKAVESILGDGETTVGTLLNVSHSSATPVGMKVSATAELISRDGRKLVFEVVAHDECGVIGSGTHERFIVGIEKFMSRTNSKLSK